jgi:hypothetical protein
METEVAGGLKGARIEDALQKISHCPLVIKIRRNAHIRAVLKAIFSYLCPRKI